MKKEEIELMVFDFDGVMTDNRVLIDETGKESVFVSRADGMGIHMLKAHGVECLILSTEKNPVVSRRAEKLEVNVLQGVDDKERALRDYVIDRGISLRNVLYVGNDINDLGVMKIAGKTAAPADAYEEVKKQADIILKTMGGYGVVREVASMLDKIFEK